MKFLKKLTSVVLSGLMLATGLPSVLADTETPNCKNTINVAVVGDDDIGKENFIKSYTTDKVKQNFEGINAYNLYHEGSKIRLFDIPSDLGAENKAQKKWINNFLESSKLNIGIPYCTYVIICMNVETEKEELVNRTYDWLKNIKSRNKDHQVGVVLYEITSENTKDYYDKTNVVIEKVCDFEREFMEEHKDVDQFRSYTEFPFKKQNILENIIEKHGIYINCSNCTLAILDKTSEHPTLTKAVTTLGLGTVGLGAVAGACYGIYKGAEKIYNKITNKSLPKKSVPNINKKA